MEAQITDVLWSCVSTTSLVYKFLFHTCYSIHLKKSTSFVLVSVTNVKTFSIFFAISVDNTMTFKIV
jgi:hypothetical protein